MSRGGQLLNVQKVVKWVIVITIIIAVVEIPFVYFYFKKEDNKTVVQQETVQTIEEKNIPGNHQTSPETPQNIIAENLSKPIVEPIKMATISIDTPKQKAALVVVKEREKTKPAPSVKKLDTARNFTTKPLVVKKTLSSTQMQEVVDQLNAKRAQSGSKMKCVKIRQTAGSNVINGFEIAGVLKSNGYIISGRETVNGIVSGILVSEGSECLLVTVGSLK